GCLTNPYSFCLKFGFQQVIMPSIIGQTSVTEARNHLNYLMYEINSWNLFIKPVFGCMESVDKFICGLHMSECVDGKHRPLCRESCQVVARTCITKSLHNSWTFLNMEYFCKFLPYQVDDPTCRPVGTS
ncbi:hypothetical protein ACJMK2_002891, partial [Sinanodonta woodiana]